MMIVVDTSAIIAIIRGEPDADIYCRALEEASWRVMSTFSYYETATVMLKYYGPEGVNQLRVFADFSAIELRGFTQDSLSIAIDAYARYGKGMGRRPFLNLGDCVSYALARSLDAPLLYKGDDFAVTDIASCLFGEANGEAGEHPGPRNG